MHLVLVEVVREEREGDPSPREGVGIRRNQTRLSSRDGLTIEQWFSEGEAKALGVRGTLSQSGCFQSST